MLSLKALPTEFQGEMKLLVRPFVDPDKPENHNLIIDVNNVVQFLCTASLKFAVGIVFFVSGDPKLKRLGQVFSDGRTGQREPLAVYVNEDLYRLLCALRVRLHRSDHPIALELQVPLWNFGGLWLLRKSGVRCRQKESDRCKSHLRIPVGELGYRKFLAIPCRRQMCGITRGQWIALTSVIAVSCFVVVPSYA